MSPTVTDNESLALIAKALSHPARIQIVELLARQAECRGSEVFSELPLAQSTVSEHLRILRDAGIVSASRLGTSTVYCLCTDALSSFTDAIARITQSGPHCEKECS